jgi:TolA-binding protein
MKGKTMRDKKEKTTPETLKPGVGRALLPLRNAARRHAPSLALILACSLGVPSQVWAQDGEGAEGAEATEPAEGEESAEAGAGEKAGDAKPAEAAKEKAEEDAEETLAPSLGKDASEEERAALKEYQKAFSRYRQESDDYQKTVDGIVESKYRQRVAQVQKTYNRQIDELTSVERQRRNNAIAAFQSFIERYPNDAAYTPDALFRLAELQFEKANDDFLLADEAFQEALVQYENGKVPDMPSEPRRDYGPTMATFQKLINDWPDYRFLDGARYLLAYCKLQEGADEEAKDILMTLIAEHPESEFIPEAWIRIGEYYFDINDLASAQLAYAEAMKYPESRFYDKALYKLAWTYYRQDNFNEAIIRFKELVEYSDAQEAKTGRSGSVLRSEAVQYIAISLAEADWDGDGISDDEFGLKRAQFYLKGEKGYEREVLAQLSEYLFENNFFDETISVVRYTLATFPDDPLNPQLHEQMVLAMFRADDMNSAFEERRQLGEFYGPGSEWYAKQEKAGEVEAMRYASSLVKDNLIQSATWFHEQAQKERDEAIVNEDTAMLASSKRKYELAAKTYAEFLKKHPNDKDAFQWNYYYAETLFYSDQYEPAYEQYRAVREMDLRDDEFEEIQEVCGLNAIKALEKVIASRVEAGDVPSKILPGGGEAAAEEVASSAPADPDAGPAAITAEPLPEIARKYVTALDRYVVLGFKNKEDPYLDSKFAFQAAKLFYDFNDFPEARRRFEWVIRNYPDQQVGAFAASLMLETYRLEKDYTTLASKANEFKDLLKGDQAETIRLEIAEYELASLGKAAEKAYQEKRYEEAIEKYKELMSRTDKEETTTIALINIAVAYEELDKPGEAAKYYERLYTEFPDNNFVPYAIYRVAVNSERFFEFDKASQNYLAFYDRFGDKETPKEVVDAFGGKFIYKEKGGDALRSGAILLENSQDYRKAADRYVEYSKRFSDRDDSDDVYWQAVQCWKKADRTRDMLSGYETYIDTHGSSQNSLKVFTALGELYDYHAEKGDDKKAKKWYERTLAEYASYGIQPGAPEAYYAAKAEFMLVEYEFEKWSKIKLSGNVKKQGKLLQEKIEGQKALTPMYEKVYAYRNLEWTLAAGFRLGNMYQRFANMLYEAPVPFPEGSEEWDIYRTQLDDIAIPLEDKAVESYVRVVAKGREEKIVNEWTKLSVQELNKYRPADYPLYKEERRAVSDEVKTGLPLLDKESYEKYEKPPREDDSKGEDS